jgi:hypothetical protein
MEERIQAVFAGREVRVCGPHAPTSYVVTYEFQGQYDDYDERSILLVHMPDGLWESNPSQTVVRGTLEEIRDAWYAQITNELLEHLKRLQSLLAVTRQDLVLRNVQPKKHGLIFVRDGEGWIVGDREVYAYPVTAGSARWRAGCKDAPMCVGNTAQEAVDSLFAALPHRLVMLKNSASLVRDSIDRVEGLIASTTATFVAASEEPE